MFLPDYPNTLTCPTTRIEILSRMPDWSSLPDYPNTLVCPTSEYSYSPDHPNGASCPSAVHLRKCPPINRPELTRMRSCTRIDFPTVSCWDIPEPPTRLHDLPEYPSRPGIALTRIKEITRIPEYIYPSTYPTNFHRPST